MNEILTKEELLKQVASGEMPGFRVKLDSERFVDGMQEISEMYVARGNLNLSRVYKDISDTISAARRKVDVEPKQLPSGITMENILRNLPFNEFLNRLDVLCYINRASQLTFGEYQS